MKKNSIAFPAPKPALKLPTHSSHPLPFEERRRLEEDLDSLRQREASLREYEAHLRNWQQRIETSQPHGGAPAASHFITPAVMARTPDGTPFETDPSLHSAWDKLIRARELLEAEQAHLRDDRLNLKEANAGLKRREDALALREGRLRQREEQLSAAVDASIAEHTKASTFARFTQAPFQMAKSVFGSKAKVEAT